LKTNAPLRALSRLRTTGLIGTRVERTGPAISFAMTNVPEKPNPAPIQQTNPLLSGNSAPKT